MKFIKTNPSSTNSRPSDLHCFGTDIAMLLPRYLLFSTKLTQSPWFLNCGKFRQPPFLH